MCCIITSYVTIGQYRIRYLETGNSKKTIVLLHGLGASAERWLPVVPYIPDDYKVIIPDIIGFGYSDKPVTNYTPKFFMEFLSSFMKNINVKKPILVGSSLGGRISIEYAIHYSANIEKMILVSPAINDETSVALQSYMQAALHPTFEDVKNAFSTMSGRNNEIKDEFIAEFIRRMNLPNAKMAFLASLLGLKKEKLTPEMFTKLRTPTLLIWGSDDQVIPISNADKFDNVTNMKYQIIEQCGHAPYAENPELFSKIMLDFLSN